MAGAVGGKRCAEARFGASINVKFEKSGAALVRFAGLSSADVSEGLLAGAAALAAALILNGMLCACRG